MKNGLLNKLSKAQLSILIIVFFSVAFLGVYSQYISQRVTTITFLDVGQGDAIFIEAPNRTQVLIDAGPNSSVIRSLSGVLPFWDRSIDIIIPTHADKDHIGGFPEILKRFSVGAVYQANSEATTSVALAFGAGVEEENAIQTKAQTGDVIVLDEKRGVYLRVLFPEKDVEDISKNDSSTVIQLVHGDIEVMLTGDAGVMVEEYLVYSYGDFLESEILKAGHHGSKTSTSQLFLETVRPEYVVISSGKENQYGHPHQEVIENINNFGSRIFETSQEGSIQFKTNGIDIWQ